MSADVYAELIIGPWNPEKLASTEAGQKLLDAIDEYGFGDTKEYYSVGVPVVQLDDWDPDRNVDSLLYEFELIELLSPLSLWCEMSDSDLSCSVLTPEGLIFRFPSIYSGPVLPRDLYNELLPHGTDALTFYYDITSRSLGEWITSEPLRLGVSPAQDVIYKALVDVSSEVESSSVTPERLMEILNDTPWYLDRILANPNVPVDMLVQYSANQSTSIRQSIAGNPNTPTPIAILLTGDENEDVVKAVQESLRSRHESTMKSAMGVACCESN